MQNGKGDKPRPTDWTKFRSNYDLIAWSKKSKKTVIKKASN